MLMFAGYIVKSPNHQWNCHTMIIITIFPKKQNNIQNIIMFIITTICISNSTIELYN